MPKKGRRSLQGVGDIWTEPKKRVNLALTPTAVQSLDAKAVEQGISRSEVVERFARNLELQLQGGITPVVT
jgi:hypothetical protein